MPVDIASCAALLAKATALFAAGGIPAAALRRHSAAARHAVWAATLLAVLLLPAMTLALPAWRLLPAWVAAPTPAALVAPAPAPAPPVVQTTTPAISTHAPTPPATAATAFAQATGPAGGPLPVAHSAVIRQPAMSLGTLLLSLWIGGAVLLLIPVALSPWALRRLRRTANPVADAHWRADLARAQNALGLRRPIELLTSARITVPMAFGIFRPAVLLPADAVFWPADRRRQILLHELAHVRRRDGLALLVARLARAAYWFHPLAWVAARRLHVEAERACDDVVLTAGAAPSAYAEALVAFAARAGRAPAAALLMARPSTLEARVRAILDARQDRRRLARAAAVAAGLLLAAGAPLAMLRAQTAPATDPANPFHFTGVVVDASGKPVANVRVEHRFSLQAYFVTSGPDGRFTFHLPKENARFGDYVAATPDGAQMAYAFYGEEKAPGADGVGIQLTLKPACAMGATVHDGDGRPVGGALVAITANMFQQVAEAITDFAGRATVHFPADAPVTDIVATKPGVGTDYFLFQTATSPATDPYHLDPSAPGPVSFVLNGVKPLTVRVVDDAGRPLAGARVDPWTFTLPDKGEDLNCGLGAFTRTTDAKGLAAFDIIPAGNKDLVTFWVDLHGYTSPDRWEADPAANKELVVTLVKKIPITGQVVDAQGRGVPNADVRLAGKGGTLENFDDYFKTDADGRFARDVAADMYYVLQAQSGHDVSPVQNKVIRRESPAPFTLPLAPGKRVVLAVTAGPKNVVVAKPSLTIYFHDDGYYRMGEQLPARDDRPHRISPTLMISAASQPDGTLEAWLAPNKYTVQCYAANDSVIEQFNVADKPDLRLDLHLAQDPTLPTTVHGRVVLADKPDAGVAEVDLESEYVTEPSGNLSSPRGTSGKDGTFTLRRVSSDYHLMALSKDRSLGAMQTVKADEDNFVVKLTPTAKATGKLVDADGKPQANIKITWGLVFRDPETRGGFGRGFGGGAMSMRYTGDGTSAADGSFTLPGLHPGKEYFLAYAPPGSREDAAHPLLAQFTPADSAPRDLGPLQVPPPDRTAPAPAPARPSELP
jgi:beta-lactamase regulating signal transducer with metallopeptidase domain